MSIEKKKQQTDCATCIYFDFDAETDMEYCDLDLDEDEMVRFLEYPTSACPYYKFYDEYKTVQKQN